LLSFHPNQPEKSMGARPGWLTDLTSVTCSFPIYIVHSSSSSFPLHTSLQSSVTPYSKKPPIILAFFPSKSTRKINGCKTRLADRVLPAILNPSFVFELRAHLETINVSPSNPKFDGDQHSLHPIILAFFPSKSTRKINGCKTRLADRVLPAIPP
jgi:hypothetical protein